MGNRPLQAGLVLGKGKVLLGTSSSSRLRSALGANGREGG